MRHVPEEFEDQLRHQPQASPTSIIRRLRTMAPGGSIWSQTRSESSLRAAYQSPLQGFAAASSTEGVWCAYTFIVVAVLLCPRFAETVVTGTAPFSASEA